MSSVDQVALLPEPGAVEVPSFFHAASCPSRSPEGWSDDTWRIRRMIVRARSALLRAQLDDASRVMVQLRRQLNERRCRHFSRYAHSARTLEACILLAKDEPAAARSLLVSVPLVADDSLAAAIVRYADWKCGECDDLCAPDTVNYLVAPVAGKTLDFIFSLCLSAARAFERLQLAVCANLATEALQLARTRYGSHSPTTSFPAVLLAQVAYERGHFEEAETLLRPRLQVIRTSGAPECVTRASVVLSNLHLHRRREQAALTVLAEAEALGRARGWPRLVSVASAQYARIVEATGGAGGTGTRRRRAGGPASASVPTEAPSWLPVSTQRWAPESDDPRGMSRSAETFASVETALRSICSIASQIPEDCRYDHLIRLLQVGAANGLRMVFVDAGPPLLSLLERLYHALPNFDPRLSDLRPYIAIVLRSAPQPKAAESASDTCRPLSRRETGILRMIAHGMSNKRIAQALGIAPETVKSHAKSIFLKLATRTRAQAVARAEASGFL